MSRDFRRARTIGAWGLLIGCIVGYPLCALTIAKNEPPVVLALSFFALIIESLNLLTSSQVHEEQAKKEGENGDHGEAGS